jgi:hypothetical protein
MCKSDNTSKEGGKKVDFCVKDQKAFKLDPLPFLTFPENFDWDRTEIWPFPREALI